MDLFIGAAVMTPPKSWEIPVNVRSPRPGGVRGRRSRGEDLNSPNRFYAVAHADREVL
jgi:hypothetical protein